jgi:hypothetical protein
MFPIARKGSNLKAIHIYPAKAVIVRVTVIKGRVIKRVRIIISELDRACNE